MDEYIPSEFYLGQNYPNPFKESTTIKYCIVYKTRVQLTVYDSDRKVIEKLVDEVKNAGTYEVEFSAKGERNLPSGRQGLAAGNYRYLLVAGYYSNEKIMILEK